MHGIGHTLELCFKSRKKGLELLILERSDDIVRLNRPLASHHGILSGAGIAHGQCKFNFSDTVD